MQGNLFVTRILQKVWLDGEVQSSSRLFYRVSDDPDNLKRIDYTCLLREAKRILREHPDTSREEVMSLLQKAGLIH